VPPDYFAVKRNGTQVDSATGRGNGSYQYTDNGPLAVGQDYSYQVCAIFGSGDIQLQGDCSNTATAHTLAQPQTYHDPTIVNGWPQLSSLTQGEAVTSLQYLLEAHGATLSRTSKRTIRPQPGLGK
jgi:hypothetical protein